MPSTKTLIFGATGAVGSAAARTAHGHGAEVILASRGISKPIPRLTSAQEQAGGFKRVQADLLDPDSVRAAVTKSGAKHAFIYAALQSTDYMRATIEALKSAGIEFIVFLSSSSIQHGQEPEERSNPIAYKHWQIENNIADIFGLQRWVTVRPGYFASNTLQWKPMIADGEVKILYPDATFDMISPEDIGRVCGAITVGGWKTARKDTIYLCGPAIRSQRDAVAAIGKVLGKDLRVAGLNEDAAFEKIANHYAAAGVPESATNDAATFFINALKGRTPGDTFTNCIYVGPAHKEGQNNILRYGRQEATTFEEWVAENKQDFV
ncbi:Nitrogen metabolite regulation-like protein [Lachnellula subtilissima]|uniref:Nitrogen metabolite regulation-like protein n=1 Tax=Lachnellula subtilissima TaxID=602034 RepID=A0A8H8RY95_9HELO|nr:Nitrogen metabolite regulation-like protein [Lachnellula subtilissima]